MTHVVIAVPGLITGVVLWWLFVRPWQNRRYEKKR